MGIICHQKGFPNLRDFKEWYMTCFKIFDKDTKDRSTRTHEGSLSTSFTPTIRSHESRALQAEHGAVKLALPVKVVGVDALRSAQELLLARGERALAETLRLDDGRGAAARAAGSSGATEGRG